MSINVLLGLAIHEVKSEADNSLAIKNFFKINVSSSVSLGSGSKEVAAHCACEVKDLALVVLCKIELISSALNGSLYILRNVKICTCSVNIYSECLSNRIKSINSKCCSKSKSNLLFCKYDSKATICSDGVLLVINCPRNGYVIVTSTNKRKLDGSICFYLVNNGKTVALDLELLLGSLFYFLNVAEAVNRYRNKIRSSAGIVVYKNTGYISDVTKVIVVECIDGGLVCSTKSGGEVSYICSDVRLLAVKCELKVLMVSIVHSLTADGYTLDGYKTCNIVVKAGACCEFGSDIIGGEALDSSINNLYNTLIEFLHAIAGRNLTANSNGHTNLDAKILNGILFHVVVEVTAYAACINNVNVVSLCACVLRTHSSNDTFNNNYIILLSSHVLFEGVNLELRNGVAVLSGERLALCVSYSELKGVGDEIITKFGNNYVNLKAIFAGLKSDSVVRNSPVDSEESVLDLNHTGNGIGCGGRLGYVLN